MRKMKNLLSSHLKIFRQINYLGISLVKENCFHEIFCQKSIECWSKLRNFTAMRHSFWQKFRQINVLLKNFTIN